VLLIGDFGELSPSWPFSVLPVKKVASAMNERSHQSSSSMILTLGDNFYSEETKEFFNTIRRVFTDIFAKEYLKDLPWYLIYGNHDFYYSKTYGELLSEFYDNVHMPSGAWNMTLQMEGFMVDFTVLPCDLICHGNSSSPLVKKHCEHMDGQTDHSSTYKWLDSHLQDLQRVSQTIWKIVLIHYPIFSVAVTGMDSENLKVHLLPILRKHEVDLVLSGHNHNMQYFYSDPQKFPNYLPQNFTEECLNEAEIFCKHSRIHCYFSNFTCPESTISCANVISVDKNSEFDAVNSSVVIPRGGLHQVVQGAGGADLDPMCPEAVSPMAEHLFGRAAHGFSELIVNKYSMTVKYYLDDNSLVFESSIVI
jgi:predicted phosphodiesterase